VQNVGRGDDESFSLTGHEEEVVGAALGKAAARWPDLHVVRWDICETDADKVAAAAGTRAEFMTPGYLHWHIRADGWVTPCQIEEAPMGHILRDPIGQIGDPGRVGAVQARAQGCRCIRRVQLPGPASAPFLGRRGPNAAAGSRPYSRPEGGGRP
jgi:MoaA/NifB/PqqE/SkfB family radical SAM enzyme